MKKLMLILLASVFASALYAAAKTEADTISARRAFIELPHDAIDLLDRETRLDMLDYFDADSIYRAKNTLRGLSNIEKITPDYLGVRLSDVSSLRIKVLPLGGNKSVVMTIHTVGMPGEADSYVSFYDSQLSPLPVSKYFPVIKGSDFISIPKGEDIKADEIEALIPFYAMKLDIDPGSNDITATLETDNLLTNEDSVKVKKYIKPGLKLIWNGKQYKKTK